MEQPIVLAPARPAPPPKNNWTTGHTVTILVIIVVIWAVGWLTPSPYVRASWLIIALLLFLFLIVTGQGINGRSDGVFIDERNKMSLSRFQLVLWTVLILAGFLADAMARVREGMVADPLGIALPEELWILMGISVTSLVGSPLIRNTKRSKEPEEHELADTMSLLRTQGVSPNEVDSEGLLVVNRDPSVAQWSDMFRGEESGNAGVIEVGKVQMFFFTIILIMAYAASLAGALASGPIGEFPIVSKGMVALIGISHAGYLGGKGVTHSDATGPRS